MRNLIQQLASSRAPNSNARPAELAALIRECERILMLAEGGAVDRQHPVSHIEPEDYPDA
jgi:hypothetical protein